jgi:hypothetical protein
MAAPAIQECVPATHTGGVEGNLAYVRREERLVGKLCTLLPVQPTITDYCPSSAPRQQSDDRDLLWSSIEPNSRNASQPAPQVAVDKTQVENQKEIFKPSCILRGLNVPPALPKPL